MTDTYEYDFLVVGAGMAGLTFALKAARHGRVGVLTKENAGSSNTAWAQGGVACVLDPGDSFERHIADTLDAGAGLCHETAVRTIVSEGPARMEDLVRLGVKFNEKPAAEGGGYDLGIEGGHTHRRILHRGDQTGLEISTRLLEAARADPNIHFHEHCYAIDLITTGKLGYAQEDRCLGLYALDQTAGEVLTFRSDRVVLATGGSGRVYQYTTNPEVATGDGVALAWRAGVTIANMEFVQFHPTCLFHYARRSFLISEALRGEGGVLVGADGTPFMHKYDRRENLAPRDIVARAIDREIKKTGSKCVFLDITAKPAAWLEDRFPHIFHTLRNLGIDMSRDPIPVVPAAHYQCGGVHTDLDGATSLRGLWAIGEVACTGLHGANRLASNSLLEAAVMGHRACHHVLRSEPLPSRRPRAFTLQPWIPGDAQDVDELVVIYHNWDEIRRLMWDYVSIVRTSKRLQRAATRLRTLQKEVQEFYWGYRVTAEVLELRNLVQVAALIVDSAQSRHESRGAHCTLDYPDIDNLHFRKDTLLWRV